MNLNKAELEYVIKAMESYYDEAISCMELEEVEDIGNLLNRFRAHLDEQSPAENVFDFRAI